MKKEQWITLAVVLISWGIFADILQNDILLPYPQDVLMQMLHDVGNVSFYAHVWSTLSRVLIGLLVSLVSGMLLGLLAGTNETVRRYFSPIVAMLKSIPNISYMILLVFWFPGTVAVTIILCLITFPLFYTAAVVGMQTISRDLRDVLTLYPEKSRILWRKFYLWHVYFHVKSALFSAVSLGFKVGVMAELLSHVSFGIGKSMNIAKINLEMTQVFAWSVWMILLLLLIEKGIAGVFAVLERRRML